MHVRSMITLAFLFVLVRGAAAQDATATPGGPQVGDVAPDFTLPVAGKDGVGSKPLTLSSLKGKTVVLAFFFRARSRG